MEQEVLAGVRTGIAGTPMTMADATRFADNALEHMVRTLGAALAAPQILESTQGALSAEVKNAQKHDNVQICRITLYAAGAPRYGLYILGVPKRTTLVDRPWVLAFHTSYGRISLGIWGG